MKGKWTRQNPEPKRIDVIEIPKEIKYKHQHMTLYFDVMFVNKVAFMTSTDDPIKFRSAVPIDNTKEDEFFRALDVILRHYNDAGYQITDGYCDNGFASMMDRVKDDLNINLHYTGADDHVPQAERNNRTIQERVRAMFHLLPFRAIPRLMIEYLVMECASKLNYFPVKGGVSPYFSPHLLLGGEVLDYNKHLKYTFGQFVMANNDNHPKNNNKTRAVEAIYLRPPSKEQTAHTVMNLHTGQRLYRRTIEPLPYTDNVIKQVETLAFRQGFKDLKFKDRTGILLHPSDWIAGVDYDTGIGTETQEDDEEDQDDPDFIPDEPGYNEEEQHQEPEIPEEDILQAQEFEEIDQSEVEGLVSDQNTNPINDADQQQDQPEPQDATGNQDGVVTDESSVSDTGPDQRPRRQTRVPETLKMSFKGKSYSE